jgi:hypothetical protein
VVAMPDRNVAALGSMYVIVVRVMRKIAGGHFQRPFLISGFRQRAHRLEPCGNRKTLELGCCLLKVGPVNWHSLRHFIECWIAAQLVKGGNGCIPADR